MQLSNLGPLNIAAGILLAMFVAVIVLGARFFVAYRNSGDDIGRAAARTGRWTFAIIGGAFAAGATGLVQLGDILGQVFAFVVGHPYFVTNVGTIGLGWLGLSGGIVITADQYVGIAMAFVGLVLLFVEVDRFAS